MLVSGLVTVGWLVVCLVGWLLGDGLVTVGWLVGFLVGAWLGRWWGG